MPLLGTLVIGEPGVQDGDFVAKNLDQVGSHCWRKADLGNEQNRRPSSFENPAHHGQVDGGLAGACDSVQQHAGKFCRFDGFQNFCKSQLLRGGEFKFKRRPARLKLRSSEVLRRLDDFDQSAAHQRAERRAGDIESLQRFDQHPATRGGECLNQCSLICIELFGLSRLRKNSVIGRDREGHEFHSCRNCPRINCGFQPLGDGRLAKRLFPQPARSVIARFRSRVGPGLWPARQRLGSHQHRNLRGPRGVAYGRDVFARNPFLANHAGKKGAGNSRCAAQRIFVGAATFALG